MIYQWVNSYRQAQREETLCNLENFSIDNMHIIKRDPYYQKLINKMIDEKAFLFTDKELNVLKNRFQFYNVKDGKIQNISNIILSNCKNNFDSMDKPDNTLYTEKELEDIKYQVYNNDIYTKLLKKFDDDITSPPDPTCTNLEFMDKNPRLNNYYLDVWGNNIISTPKDYMANYYTTINKDDSKECVPVKTIKGNSNFIIPDPYINFTPFQGPIQNAEYNNENHSTNIWNIDNERIINPLTAY